MSAKSQPNIAGHLPERRRVRFEFFHPTARRVCVAGDFNGWNPTATPLRSLGDGRWLRELRLPLKRHEYLLVVDGEWKFDPRAAEYVPNIFGGMNAVVDVHALAVRPTILKVREGIGTEIHQRPHREMNLRSHRSLKPQNKIETQ